MRGRRPKPDAIKALAGNPGKRRRRADPAPLAEGTPVGVGIAQLNVPEPPEYLTIEAAIEWRRLAGDMVRLGLLRRLDLGAFEARCELYGTWRRCRDVLRQAGISYEHKGLIRQRPEVRLAQECLRQMRQYDGEFGLTPAARARVAHVTGGEGEQPRLPLDDQPQSDPTKAPPLAAQPQENWTDDEFFRGPAH